MSLTRADGYTIYDPGTTGLTHAVNDTDADLLYKEVPAGDTGSLSVNGDSPASGVSISAYTLAVGVYR